MFWYADCSVPVCSRSGDRHAGLERTAETGQDKLPLREVPPVRQVACGVALREPTLEASDWPLKSRGPSSGEGRWPAGFQGRSGIFAVNHRHAWLGYRCALALHQLPAYYDGGPVEGATFLVPPATVTAADEAPWKARLSRGLPTAEMRRRPKEYPPGPPPYRKERLEEISSVSYAASVQQRRNRCVRAWFVRMGEAERRSTAAPATGREGGAGNSRPRIERTQARV
jgi:hypothetical protein